MPDDSRELRAEGAFDVDALHVPQMVALCDDPAVQGSDLYVMQTLEGTVLRGRLPRGLALIEDDACGLGPGYVRRQVAGWSDRYRAARTEDVPDVEPVMAWLDARQPPDVAMCLIHNDFRLDNRVLDDDLQVVGVLDWEMATVGDPLMDLGGALAYRVQADDDELTYLESRCRAVAGAV